MVPYRAEWRYGIYAHRVALIDAGHMGQNLYLACTGLNLGTCAIGAFEDPVCNRLFELDGEEEYIVYTAPVGTVRESDTAEEAAFYAFVEQEGL
jgi:SagB-type dehydrogenase family enzyme